jgi:hypothetical protein
LMIEVCSVTDGTASTPDMLTISIGRSNTACPEHTDDDTPLHPSYTPPTAYVSTTPAPVGAPSLSTLNPDAAAPTYGPVEAPTFGPVTAPTTTNTVTMPTAAPIVDQPPANVGEPSISSPTVAQPSSDVPEGDVPSEYGGLSTLVTALLVLLLVGLVACVLLCLCIFLRRKSRNLEYMFHDVSDDDSHENTTAWNMEAIVKAAKVAVERGSNASTGSSDSLRAPGSIQLAKENNFLGKCMSWSWSGKEGQHRPIKKGKTGTRSTKGRESLPDTEEGNLFSANLW